MSKFVEIKTTENSEIVCQYEDIILTQSKTGVEYSYYVVIKELGEHYKVTKEQYEYLRKKLLGED